MILQWQNQNLLLAYFTTYFSHLGLLAGHTNFFIEINYLENIQWQESLRESGECKGKRGSLGLVAQT